MKRDFLLNDSGDLCMDGYPLSIRRRVGGPISPMFELLEGGQRVGIALSLEEAKQRLNSIANDIDVFTP